MTQSEQEIIQLLRKMDKEQTIKAILELQKIISDPPHLHHINKVSNYRQNTVFTGFSYAFDLTQFDVF